jgi:NADP-dependent 3-hydroxy acid dehydrogenase YdfG
MAKLEGKVAFITGASSGIGAAMAREFARRGAHVVLTARRWERLEALALEVRARGRRALTTRCDVTSEGDLDKAVEAAIEEFGRIDWVVANAGFGVAGAVHKLALEDYRRQFETNVFGVLRTVQATREALIASRGSLAIMGSVMSKHAVRALAASLRAEMTRHGVGVTLLAPGFVDSEIRQVDNQGERHEGAPDRIPSWVRMDADKAAVKLVKAVLKRKRVAVITGHAKFFVYVERHFPWFISFLVRVVRVEKRRHRKV